MHLHVMEKGMMRNLVVALLVAVPSAVVAQTPSTLVALRGATAVSVSQVPDLLPADRFAPVDLASAVGLVTSDSFTRAPTALQAGAMTAADLARVRGWGSTAGSVWTQDERVAQLAAHSH